MEQVPESWRIASGINTSPRPAWADEGVTPTYNELTEIYAVKAQIWKAAGMTPLGGLMPVTSVRPSGRARRSPITGFGGQGRPFGRAPTA